MTKYHLVGVVNMWRQRMTKVNCNITECSYSKNSLCTKEEINIFLQWGEHQCSGYWEDADKRMKEEFYSDKKK